jgi:UTP--glucose-1-phosphate uridylyltransferase
MNTYISSDLKHAFRQNGIDENLTLSILDSVNKGEFDHIKPVTAAKIPGTDGKRVLDMTNPSPLSLPHSDGVHRLESLFGKEGKTFLPRQRDGDLLQFTPREIEKVGIALFGRCAYGILNGGSATSYADEKKNQAFNGELFSLYKPYFDQIAPEVKGKAKGITPAFINPDGTPGPSYLELKMRALLIRGLQYHLQGGEREHPLPLFQMTSGSNNGEISQAYQEYGNSPLLKPLMAETGIEVRKVKTGIQPLIAAYTHSKEGRPKEIFTRAFGKEGAILPLPGGHGQNFIALRKVYKELLEEGYRYAMLGNVDNLGTTPDPLLLGYLALSGKEAAFEFSFKTAVDVKGGILVEDTEGNLTCADIGPAISGQAVAEQVQKGKQVLFNCASAIFDLEFLCSNLEHIIHSLPTRFTDQEKDAGAYSQAEQVSWEIIGMLDDFLIFGVRKQERFLAAKMVMDTFLTSGLLLDDPDFPASPDEEPGLKELAETLHSGLKEKLHNEYGMKQENNRWIPVKIEELKERYRC